MKKIIFIFMLIASTSFANEFKVISYNIWNGFDFGKGAEQEAKFCTLMEKENPDVVAYQELCRFNSSKLKKLAKNIGHPYSVIQKVGGYPVGISSKYPITEVKKLRTGFWHGALSCKINGINFIVVHFSPSYADYRMNESNLILKFLEKTNKINEKTIVLGDFNSHSRFDEEFLESQGMYEDDNFNDFSVMQNFLDNGLTDSRTLVEGDLGNPYSFPAHLLVSETESFGGQVLIDYQLVTEKMLDDVVSFEVIKNDLTMNISDHYPVKVLYKFYECRKQEYERKN